MTKILRFSVFIDSFPKWSYININSFGNLLQSITKPAQFSRTCTHSNCWYWDILMVQWMEYRTANLRVVRSNLAPIYLCEIHFSRESIFIQTSQMWSLLRLNNSNQVIDNNMADSGIGEDHTGIFTLIRISRINQTWWIRKLCNNRIKDYITTCHVLLKHHWASDTLSLLIYRIIYISVCFYFA